MKLNLLILSTLLIMASCSHADIVEYNPTTSKPIEQIVKYNPDIQRIMFNHCITCHSGAVPQSGLNFSTYEMVKQSVKNGAFIQRLNNQENPMPPSGLLPLHQRQLIEKWRKDNYPK